MKKPGETFIYTEDGIEYCATIISHDTNNNTCKIMLLGSDQLLTIDDSDVPNK